MLSKMTTIMAGCGTLALLGLTACSDGPTAGERQRLEAQIQELSQQVRQYRAEVQRSNEKIVAMLQAHGLQSDNPPATPLSTLNSGTGAGTGMSQAGGRSPSAMSADEVIAALHQSHATMGEQMMSAPMTGDPDRDFIAMMIPHHQGAIDMARIVIAGGKRPEVRKFAADIISHQQAEIDMMNRWLQAPPQ